MEGIFIIVYVILCFVLQRLLLQKADKAFCRFLPLILIGVIYVVCAMLPFMDSVMNTFGRNDGYSFYGFWALVAAGVNTLGLMAVGAAWIYDRI